MSHGDNIRRLLRATSPILASLAIAPLVGAQPSASDTMQAYRTVNRWVRAWSVPQEPQRLDPPGATAASVTLRLAGRVMGRASSARNDEENLWRASRRAWQEATQRLPVERDALRRESLHALAPKIMIDVQLAGVMTPIVATSLRQAAFSVSPGRQGVAARVGDRVEAVFPDAMLSMNMTPAQGFSAALGALGMPPTVDLNDARRHDGLILYRFDAQHLAQPAPGEQPIFLTRGGRMISLASVTPRSIRAFGDRLATNLIGRQWPGAEPFGLMGTYDPWLDQYEKPVIAGPLEQALAALALARWSLTPGVEEPMRDASARQSHKILKQLEDVAPTEIAPSSDVAASSMLTLAYITIAQWDSRDNPAPAKPAPPASSAPVSVARDDPPQPPPIAALRTYTHAMSATLYDNRELRALARGEIRDLFRATPPADLPALMPWLGWAELTLLTPGDAVPSAVALREFRDLVEAHQISAADAIATGDENFVGGIVFTKGGARPLPTWQSIRPLIFLATMLGDDRLTSPDERSAHLVHLLDGLRYVMQLAVDKADCHLCPNPERAIGGVRLALWDQREPVESTAMALLLVAETLDAVDRIAAGHDE